MTAQRFFALGAASVYCLAMRLYHRPGSRSERVLWVLGEIQAPYDVCVVPQAEQAASAHRARHPLGRVPVLDDGVGSMFESAAICLHLADLHPDAGLIAPIGSHERARAYQWAFFALTELETPLADISYGTPAGDGRGADARYPRPEPEQVAAARARFRRAAGAVEQALGKRRFLIAGRFGVADVLVGSVLAWADDIGLISGNHPELAGYLKRLRARPAYTY